MRAEALGWEAFVIGAVVFVVVYLVCLLVKASTASGRDNYLKKIDEYVWRFDRSKLALFLVRYWRGDDDPYRQSHFELLLTEYQNIGARVFDGFFRDARYTFHLRYGQSTVAGIGFNITDDQAVVVIQIQGVKGKTEILKLLKWERLLLAIVIVWARDQGYKEVRVKKGDNNQWLGRGASRASFIMHHDVTAKRSGLKFNNDLGCFQLKLDN